MSLSTCKKALSFLPLCDTYFIQSEFESFLICRGRYYNITTITSCKNKTKKLFPSSQTLFPLKIERRYYGYILQQKIYRVVGSMNSYYILGTKWKNPSKAFLLLVGDEKTFLWEEHFQPSKEEMQYK